MDEDFTRLETLRDLLRFMPSAAVAFSGGVDSTLLLKVASEVLGERVRAVTAVSVISSRRETAEAVNLARLIGVPHDLLETDELTDPAFAANPPDRCYLCKKTRFLGLREAARRCGIDTVIDGTNADDARDYRPGLRAVRELGIRSPLCEAGLGKEQIRRLSRALGLPTWDKPALACLASRIPYGSRITEEMLRQVDEGETFLWDLGLFKQVRVRHHGLLARLEVDAGGIAALAADPLRKQVAARFRKLGFRHIALDLEGYAMGSLNRDIGKGES